MNINGTEEERRNHMENSTTLRNDELAWQKEREGQVSFSFFITFNRILLYRILRIGGIIWTLLLLHLGYWLCLSVHMEFIDGLNMYLRIVRNLKLVINYIWDVYY